MHLGLLKISQDIGQRAIKLSDITVAAAGCKVISGHHKNSQGFGITRTPFAVSLKPVLDKLKITLIRKGLAPARHLSRG